MIDLYVFSLSGRLKVIGDWRWFAWLMMRGERIEREFGEFLTSLLIQQNILSWDIFTFSFMGLIIGDSECLVRTVWAPSKNAGLRLHPRIYGMSASHESSHYNIGRLHSEMRLCVFVERETAFFVIWSHVIASAYHGCPIFCMGGLCWLRGPIWHTCLLT